MLFVDFISIFIKQLYTNFMELSIIRKVILFRSLIRCEYEQFI